jgi:PhnB protein
MISIHPYLNFNGTCLEAFEFYKSIFGGEFSYVGRFSEMPLQEGESIPDEIKDLIMHISLPINDNMTLMGSDVHESFGQTAVQGSSVELMVALNDKEEALRVWERLSEDAKILMDFHAAFWGDYYGNLIDKYGIRWSVNCPIEE